jgi:hypothetical protein
MNRKLIVTLLRKDIQELEMITEGFMEMNEYPKAIILLAQRKIEDIQSYINQLSEIKSDDTCADINDANLTDTSFSQEQPKPEKTEPITESDIDTETSDEIHEEIDAALELTSELVEIDAENLSNEETENEKKDIEAKKNAVFNTDKKEIDDLEMNEKSQIHENEQKYSTDNFRQTIYGEKIVPATPSTDDNISPSTLTDNKISDIKQAISIGDRFRFQRELFHGNGEDMNKTLTYLNLLATLEEALSFLRSKYGWTSDNETAEDFYQIVRRRFL